MKSFFYSCWVRSLIESIAEIQRLIEIKEEPIQMSCGKNWSCCEKNAQQFWGETGSESKRMLNVPLAGHREVQQCLHSSQYKD